MGLKEEPGDLSSALLIGLIIGGVIGALIGLVDVAICGLIYHVFKLEDRIIKRYIGRFARQEHEAIVKAFFPDGQSITRQPHDWSLFNPKLALPEPPDDVKQTLWRAKYLPLKVAAVAEAISFTQTPAEILLQQRAADEAEQRRRWTELWADPIVYYEHGSAVAIIAQYGNFLIEKGVIDEVVNSDYLV